MKYYLYILVFLVILLIILLNRKNPDRKRHAINYFLLGIESRIKALLVTIPVVFLVVITIQSIVAESNLIYQILLILLTGSIILYIFYKNFKLGLIWTGRLQESAKNGDLFTGNKKNESEYDQKPEKFFIKRFIIIILIVVGIGFITNFIGKNITTEKTSPQCKEDSDYSIDRANNIICNYKKIRKILTIPSPYENCDRPYLSVSSISPDKNLFLINGSCLNDLQTTGQVSSVREFYFIFNLQENKSNIVDTSNTPFKPSLLLNNNLLFGVNRTQKSISFYLYQIKNGLLSQIGSIENIEGAHVLLDSINRNNIQLSSDTFNRTDQYKQVKFVNIKNTNNWETHLFKQEFSNGLKLFLDENNFKLSIIEQK